MIPSPQNSIRKVPMMRNGPNGIMLFIPFFPNITSAIPMIEPRMKDIRIAKVIIGHPTINPIKKPNLTSPPPIPFPLVKNTIKKKKVKDAEAANKRLRNIELERKKSIIFENPSQKSPPLSN